MSDAERKLWVQNDEGLYTWWQESRMSLSEFVAANREELTSIIRRALEAKPAQKTWRDYQ